MRNTATSGRSRPSDTATGGNCAASASDRARTLRIRYLKIKWWMDRQMFAGFAIVWWAITAWMIKQALTGRPEDVVAALIAAGAAVVFTWAAVRMRRTRQHD